MDLTAISIILLVVVCACGAGVFALLASAKAVKATEQARSGDPVSEGFRFYERLVAGRAAPGKGGQESMTERSAHDLLFNADLAIVLFNFSPDAIIVADDQGHIAQANRQAELLTGYPRSELQGGSVDHLLPEDLRKRHVGHRQAFMEDPRLRPMGAHLDLRLRRKNGTEIPVDINLSPVATTRGMYVIATIRRKSAVAFAPRLEAPNAPPLLAPDVPRS